MNNIYPYNIEAERAILFCILENSEKLNQALNEIDIQDFYVPQNQDIFHAVCRCVEDIQMADFTTVTKYLNESLRNVLMNEILYAHVVSEVYSHYFEILKEFSKRRKLIKLNAEIMESARNMDSNIDELIIQAEHQIMDIDTYNADELTTAKEIYAKFHNELAVRARKKERFPGIATGLMDFDCMTGGLIGGYLYVIAARPAMGKSALSNNIASRINKKGYPVAIFTLEMSNTLVMQRLVAEEALVSNTNIKHGVLESEEWNRVVNSSRHIAKETFFIDDAAGINADYISMKCKRINNYLKKQDKPSQLHLVVVDYLQIMSGKHKEQRLNVEENCRMLKKLAKELNVAIILLSQLNRANEARQDKRPSLSDLRESGAIEQDADLVAMIYRDEYYNPKTNEPGISEIIFCKQRDGATGTIKLGWNGEMTRFSDLNGGV